MVKDALVSVINQGMDVAQMDQQKLEGLMERAVHLNASDTSMGVVLTI